MIDPFAQLNPRQREAIDIIDGPLLVLAGAGSGKTRVVTLRIVNMLRHGIPASQILGLTFTNKAAAEMRERVHALAQSEVLISTFHSFGAKILRESIDVLGYKRSFTIYDEDDSTRLLKICAQEVGLSDEKAPIKELRSYISQIKNGGSKLVQNSLHSQAYQLYQDKLKEYNAVDFDDLLALPVKLLEEHPDIRTKYQQRWRYMLIDEYQDTNAIQYSLVKLLTENSHNLCVVGDPDQSIYSWRGARMENIINFEFDYPDATIVRLEQNYRSRSNILEIANALIKHNKTRLEKNLWSDLGPGESVKAFTARSENEEAVFVADRLKYHHRHHEIPWDHMVVFYRTHALSRSFEDLFQMLRIPYIIVGGISFYQRREVKDILAYLQMVQDDSNFIAFMRTVNLPKRGIGKGTLDKIVQGASIEGFGIFTYCQMLVDGVSTIVKLPKKQKEALKDYVNIILKLRDNATSTSLTDLIISTIELSGYKNFLREDPESYDQRQENLEALVNKAEEWSKTATEISLSSFLEELSLRSDIADQEGSKARVNLMSLHNGKGLEYDIVFLTGLEETILPHINSFSEPDGVEEERRLCYVGMTRAKEQLYLTNAASRLIWGQRRNHNPSRFLKELPDDAVEEVEFASSPSSERVKEKEKSPTQQRLDFRNTEKVPLLKLQKGDLISHAKYGIGTLISIEDGVIGLSYKIQFVNDPHERTLIANHAHLKKL